MPTAVPQLVTLSELQLNDQNPRLIKDARFQQLVDSLIAFPEMQSLRPAVADEVGLILGGNQRTRAKLHILDFPKKKREGLMKQALAKRQEREEYEAGGPEEVAYQQLLVELFTSPQVLVQRALGLTDHQKREFIIKDNHGFGENDWEALANGEWGDAAQLNDWGVDLPNDWGVEPEGEITLPSGDKPAFKQITFTLTDLQAQDVLTALGLAKGEAVDGFEGTGNENSNGNALAAIVAEYTSKRNHEA